MSVSSPFRQLFLSWLRQFHREPEAVFWVYVFPLLMIVGLGLAFKGGDDSVARVRVIAADAEAGERLAAALEEAGAFEVVLGSSQDEVRAGGQELTVLLDEDGVEYRVDPTQAESLLAREWVDRILQEGAGRIDPLRAEVQEVTAPGSRYIDWVIPGLLGLNIMGSSMWGVGFSAVDLRIRKVLKRLRATPMRRMDFLGSLITSRVIFLALEVALILAFGRILFGMPIVGGPLSIAVICILGAAAFASLSLLVGSRASKIETISGWMNAVQVPMWLLSGVFFSWERFPESLQPLIRALPLTQLNNALRAVILEGAPLWGEWPELVGLSLWSVASFGLAMRFFRWQ